MANSRNSTAFFNGPILTMNDDQPSAEALLVRDGMIEAVGTREEVEAIVDAETERVDLRGQALLPGFIDPHSHLMFAVQFQAWANVAGPPQGSVTTVEDIVAELKRFQVSAEIAPGEWILGSGYSELALPGRKHVTVDDLDPHFPDNPVLLLHYSGHGCVLNTVGLQRFGVTADTPTPDGGVIGRKAGTNTPNGYLFDTAYIPIVAAMPRPSDERTAEALKRALANYASSGVTTAQEGATSLEDLRMLQRAAEDGRLVIDVNSLPVFMDFQTTLNDQSIPWNRNQNGLRCAGIKLLCDGSPQSLTGFFTEPYLVPGPAGESGWTGEPLIPQETVDQVTKACYAKGVRTFTHANGDAAIDMLITAQRNCEPDGKAAGRRPVAIHSQFIREDQLDTFVELGIVPSFFTNHAYYFSDSHQKKLGDKRTDFLSPMRSAIDRGLIPTNHSDAVVTPLDPMFTVWTAVARQAKDGRIVGEEERITVLEALKAITVWAAYEHGEEDSKGQLQPGFKADLVVLDRDPLETETASLPDIKATSTYKNGKLIYSRGSE